MSRSNALWTFCGGWCLHPRCGRSGANLARLSGFCVNRYKLTQANSSSMVEPITRDQPEISLHHSCDRRLQVHPRPNPLAPPLRVGVVFSLSVILI